MPIERCKRKGFDIMIRQRFERTADLRVKDDDTYGEEARRIRHYRISPVTLVDLIQMCFSPSHRSKIFKTTDLNLFPDCPDIPDGTRVQSIIDVQGLNVLLVSLQHPSFELIPEGEAPPMYPNKYTKYYTITRERLEKMGGSFDYEEDKEGIEKV